MQALNKIVKQIASFSHAEREVAMSALLDFMLEVEPDGKKDHHRWLPSEIERCGCCAEIRTPSFKWPLSLLTHCKSLQHRERKLSERAGVNHFVVHDCGLLIKKWIAASEFKVTAGCFRDFQDRLENDVMNLQKAA